MSSALNGEGALLIVEIKSSVADFRADRKWRDYAAHCDRLYFAISRRHAGRDHAGGGRPDRRRRLMAREILREPPPRAIAPATRRAVLLRFAQAAADRLHRLADPGLICEF